MYPQEKKRMKMDVEKMDGAARSRPTTKQVVTGLMSALSQSPENAVSYLEKQFGGAAPMTPREARLILVVSALLTILHALRKRPHVAPMIDRVIMHMPDEPDAVLAPRPTKKK